MYIDVHCHLTGDEFEEVGGVQETLKRAEKNGVGLVVCSGFDLPSSKRAKELAENYDNVYFCAGFHPSELKKYREGDLDEIRALCNHEKCVAVGEIGLDYHFDDNPSPELQRELFHRQLELADELGLPVVIHSRDAAQETLEAKIYKALDKLEALIQHNEADIATWLPLEYELNFTYGSEETAFCSYMERLRAEINRDCAEKIRAAEEAGKQTK